jgi:hypothetical protein
MKHYSAEEWIDFVNSACSTARKQEMQNHLDGCKRCAKTLGVWQKVRVASQMERQFQPPTDALRVVKAAFSGRRESYKAGFGSIVAQLLFDSLAQPMLSGVRGGNVSSRQMLFSADRYQLDVSIEAKPDSSHILITGQLLDLKEDDSVARGVTVTFSNRRGDTIQTATNDHGEFHGEIPNRGDLEISFPGPGDKPIVVSIADALGRLNASTPGPQSRGRGKNL